uniref:SH2 domain-containing protein n=1 Tax=Salarias fasciatus TaxID=181472 RepID=A0A672FXG0_SALFA
MKSDTLSSRWGLDTISLYFLPSQSCTACQTLVKVLILFTPMCLKTVQENIPGKPFSFWAWLDFILSLIKEHLTPLWNDNYIMGFVSKETERALLKDREPGTFLLRFSESHLGGITFTWVERGMDGERSIFSDGVLNDLLKFLYPDIPKDEAFSRFYSTQPQRPEPSEPPITPGEFESLSLDMEIISLI